MKNKFRFRAIIFLVTVYMLISTTPMERLSAHTEVDIPDFIDQFNLVKLDELPISLDDLFCLDNYTEFEFMLDSIEAGTAFWPIKPFGTFFGHGHPEGVPRMDLNPYRINVTVRAPIDCTIEWQSALNGYNVIDVNDVDCIEDCAIGLDLGNTCLIDIGHLHLVKTLFDEFESSGSKSLAKGEILGYTMGSGDFSIVDFSYQWNNGEYSIPPHYAFTPELLGKVEVLYNFLFERAKLNGLYPRAYMINEMNIHKAGEFWGGWYYKTGPYDSIIDPEIYIAHYDFGVLTLLNREFTSPETYWKNSIEPSKNLTSDILGIYANRWESTTPGFKALGEGHILLYSGDNSSGIIELETFVANDYGPKGTKMYGKFEVQPNATSLFGDELLIEFFPTLGEAQSGFTVNVSTYYRNHINKLEEYNFSSEIPTETSNFYYIIPTLVSFIMILSILKRSKKN